MMIAPEGWKEIGVHLQQRCYSARPQPPLTTPYIHHSFDGSTVGGVTAITFFVDSGRRLDQSNGVKNTGTRMRCDHGTWRSCHGAAITIVSSQPGPDLWSHPVL